VLLQRSGRNGAIWAPRSNMDSTLHTAIQDRFPYTAAAKHKVTNDCRPASKIASTKVQPMACNQLSSSITKDA